MAKRTKKPRAINTGPVPRGLEVASPVELGAIVGQPRAVKLLRAALTTGRLHHAWIFHGPAGVGKFTTAMSFAAALLDPGEGPEAPGDAVAREHVRTLLEAGTHPDLHVVTKELARFSSNPTVRNAKLMTIPKDVVTTHLIEPAGIAGTMRTGSVASKVFVVDEAELLDPSPARAPVQNALLKTLEEPAPGTVIILVTSNEDRLLATIRSRCQRVAFTALAGDDMERWFAASPVSVEGEERDWLLEYAGGSPGRLVRAAEDGLYAWHKRLDPLLRGASQRRYSPELGELMKTLVDDWAKEWVKRGDRADENRSKDTANRAGARLMFAMLGEHYRQGLQDDDTRAHALGAISRIEEAERRLASNVQMRFVFEGLSVGLSG